MSVSFYVDKAATQEMNMALTQGAVSFNAEDLIPKDLEAENLARNHKTAQEMSATELIEKNQGNKFTTEVLKPFFARLGQVGITPSKDSIKMKDEISKLASDVESYEDMVEIRENPTLIKEAKRLMDEGQGRRDEGRGTTDEVMALLKEYAAAFTEYIESQTHELSARVKELRQKLIEKGISEAKLANLEAGLREGRRTDLSEALKDAIVFQLLSADNLVERTIYRRKIADIMRGQDPTQAREMLEKASFKAAQELQSFTFEEMENALIKLTHMQDGDTTQVVKLFNLADKTKIDYPRWIDEVWEKKKDDHGLYLLDVPHSVTGNMVDTNTDNPQKRHGFEYEKKDEDEVLVNRLRALYMQRILKGDAFTHLATEFKIRKMKNGLFRLGIFTQDMDEQVKHEAEIVAKIKILEMLKEALIERASFYDLAGPAHQLVERKIKGLIKNAERLGMPISTAEFNLMRDNANRRIFELSMVELKDVQARRNAKDSQKLEQKETLLVKLLARLKAESRIEGASFAQVGTID